MISTFLILQQLRGAIKDVFELPCSTDFNVGRMKNNKGFASEN